MCHNVPMSDRQAQAINKPLDKSLAPPIHQATQALLVRFHRQKPVRTGSLLITVLGDSIAPRGGIVTLGSLIRLAAPFDLPERLVRTSVGRLANEGWLS